MESKKPINGHEHKAQPSRTLHAKSGAKKPLGTTDAAESQVTRNQEELGVGKDHRTADMIKKRRGTFP